MTRRRKSMKKRKNPIGMAIALGVYAAAIGGAIVKGAVENKAQKKTDAMKSKAAEVEAISREQELIAKQSQTADTIAKNNAASSIAELNQRERLHAEMVAQEHATTSYVDKYRAQANMYDDNLLNNLWSEERKLAEETMDIALQQEQKELDDSGENSNFGKIALYSIIGIASIGALVYSKKRFKK